MCNKCRTWVWNMPWFSCFACHFLALSYRLWQLSCWLLSKLYFLCALPPCLLCFTLLTLLLLFLFFLLILVLYDNLYIFFTQGRAKTTANKPGKQSVNKTMNYSVIIIAVIITIVISFLLCCFCPYSSLWE